MKFRLYEGRRTIPHTKKEMGSYIKQDEPVVTDNIEAEAELQVNTKENTDLDLEIQVTFNYSDSKKYSIYGLAKFTGEHWELNPNSELIFGPNKVYIYEDGRKIPYRFFNSSNLRDWWKVLFGKLGHLNWEGISTIHPVRPEVLVIKVLNLLNMDTEELEQTHKPADGVFDLEIISDGSGNFKPEALIELVINYLINGMEREDPELLRAANANKGEE